MNRREWLTGGLTAGIAGIGALAALGSEGCNVVRARVAPLRDTSQRPIAPPEAVAATATGHLLNRAAFGPTVRDQARLEELGQTAWLNEQFAAPTGDEGEPPALRLRLRPLASLNTVAPTDLEDLGDKDVLAQMQQAAILRATYSPWQLRERMVDFWSDHFNIYAQKNDGAFLVVADSAQVVRTHALGFFPDLLKASAHSPAMLGYLDNEQNRRGVANENYARELMELHSLGVDGGYTQKDVQEVARCLTGWTVEDRFLHCKGTFRFDADRHDDGAKTVLGTTIPSGGGESDGDRVLDLLAKHPATARHIARKLVRHFVGGGSPTLTETIARTYTESGGHIPSLLRDLFASPEFAARTPALKRPFDYLVSALRVTNAETDGGAPLQRHLARMGQPLYEWPMPDGYPDRTAAWTGTLLHRWNFAVALAHGGIDGTTVEHPKDATGDDRIATILSQRADAVAARPARDAIAAFAGDAPTQVALLLSSPLFQWR